jgi:hypothetical protein
VTQRHCSTAADHQPTRDGSTAHNYTRNTARWQQWAAWDRHSAPDTPPGHVDRAANADAAASMPPMHARRQPQIARGTCSPRTNAAKTIHAVVQCAAHVHEPELELCVVIGLHANPVAGAHARDGQHERAEDEDERHITHCNTDTAAPVRHGLCHYAVAATGRQRSSHATATSGHIHTPHSPVAADAGLDVNHNTHINARGTRTYGRSAAG